MSEKKTPLELLMETIESSSANTKEKHKIYEKLMDYLISQKEVLKQIYLSSK